MVELTQRKPHPLERRDKGAVVGLKEGRIATDERGRQTWAPRTKVAFIEPGSTYTDARGRNYMVMPDGSVRRMK